MVGGRASDGGSEERAALRAFGLWLGTQPQALIDAARVGDREVDAAIAALRRSEVRALTSGDTVEMERAAADLGRTLADHGVPMRVWFRIVSTYRNALLADRGGGPDEAARRVAGFARYVDVLTDRLGDAYSERQVERLTAARGDAELYAALVQQSPGPKAVYEWTAPPDLGSWRVLAANPAARRMLPPVEGIVGGALGPMFPEFADSEFAHRVVLACDHGDSGVFVVRPRRGGVYETRAVRIRPRVVGVVFYDVTDRMALEEALEARLAEVEDANRSLDAFAYVASHDLKAPLRDIGNLAAWVAEDAADALPEASRRHLTILRERVGRLDRLLDDLLAYSRAARGDVVVEATTIGAIVDEAAALAGPRNGFELAVAGGELGVRVARTPLVHVVRNLIHNAVKHHDRGAGRIDVRAAVDPRGELRLSVADDGPGIAPEYHEQVFRPLVTLRPRDQLEGSGMGLAIVRRLVERHGGTVAITSDGGRGATFEIRWPCAPGAEGAA